MKINIQTPKNDEGKINFTDGKLVVIVNGMTYECEYSFLPTDKTLYSLPSNDAHIAWTPSKNIDMSNIIASEHRTNLIKQWWSPFKKGQVVRGIIVNNKFLIKR